MANVRSDHEHYDPVMVRATVKPTASGGAELAPEARNILADKRSGRHPEDGARFLPHP